MKVNPSVKPICDHCKVIRRNGNVMVICKRTRVTSSARASHCSLASRVQVQHREHDTTQLRTSSAGIPSGGHHRLEAGAPILLQTSTHSQEKPQWHV